MIEKLLIFISSTSDLNEERQAVKHCVRDFALLYEPYLYEDDPARTKSPEERCREMVERSDVFVGILGARYGTPYPPPGEKGSIVEWEFDTARGSDDRLMAMMVKDIPDSQVEPPQLKFIKRVEGFGSVWRKKYNTSAELCNELLRALIQWSGELALATQKDREQRSSRLHRFLKPTLAGITVLIGLTLVALLYASVITPAVAAGVCAILAASLVAGILFS